MRELLRRELEEARDRVAAALGKENPEQCLLDILMAQRSLSRAFDEADLEAHIARQPAGSTS